MDRSLRIQLSEDGADAERLDSLTRYLRQELLLLDGTEVKQAPAGQTPPGTRASEVLEVGGLLVALITSDALRLVVLTIRGWLSRGHSATHALRLEIDGDVLDLSAASTAEQDQLIDLFVTRHSARKDEAWAANERP